MRGVCVVGCGLGGRVRAQTRAQHTHGNPYNGGALGRTNERTYGRDGRGPVVAAAVKQEARGQEGQEGMMRRRRRRRRGLADFVLGVIGKQKENTSTVCTTYTIKRRGFPLFDRLRPCTFFVSFCSPWRPPSPFVARSDKSAPPATNHLFLQETFSLPVVLN